MSAMTTQGFSDSSGNAALDLDLIQVEQKLDTLHADTVTVEAKLDALHTDTVAVGTKLDTLDADSAAVKTSVDAVKASTDAVKTSADAVKTSVDATKASTDAVKASVDALRTTHNTNEVFEVLTGGALTLAAGTYNSVSYVVIAGTATINVGGTTIAGLPTGYSGSHACDQLLANAIQIAPVGAGGRVIVTTIK